MQEKKYGRRKTDRVKPRFRGALYLTLILAWGIIVWPTPYFYKTIGLTPIRINRLTGSVDFCSLQGWLPQLRLFASPPSAEQKIEAAPATPTPAPKIEIEEAPEETPTPSTDFPMRHPWSPGELPKRAANECMVCCCENDFQSCAPVCHAMENEKMDAPMAEACINSCPVPNTGAVDF